MGRKLRLRGSSERGQGVLNERRKLEKEGDGRTGEAGGGVVF